MSKISLEPTAAALHHPDDNLNKVVSAADVAFPSEYGDAASVTGIGGFQGLFCSGISTATKMPGEGTDPAVKYESVAQFMMEEGEGAETRPIESQIREEIEEAE